MKRHLFSVELSQTISGKTSATMRESMDRAFKHNLPEFDEPVIECDLGMANPVDIAEAFLIANADAYDFFSGVLPKNSADVENWWVAGFSTGRCFVSDKGPDFGPGALTM